MISSCIRISFPANEASRLLGAAWYRLAREMESTQIGAYVVEIEGNHLSVTRRISLFVMLGICPRRPLVSVLGPSEVGDTSVSKRRLRGTEVKRPLTARAWQVRVLDPTGKRLGRTLQFRSSEEAERLSEFVQRYAREASV